MALATSLNGMWHLLHVRACREAVLSDLGSQLCVYVCVCQQREPGYSVEGCFVTQTKLRASLIDSFR